MTNKQKVYIEEWKSLPWKKFEMTLFRLQHRLYEASKEKDLVKIKKLQSLILGSASSRYLAVRQVTQLNTGRKTAGVDGRSSLNERLQLAEKLMLGRVYIPELRPLGIPTLKDRAMECLLKYALEPYYEANASDGSWGFRPGRCSHDVQKIVFINLNSNANGHTKSILKLDIEKCFEKINHDKLLSLVVLPNSAKKVVRSALKAGVLKGGVISPLLCNIALNGIEDLHNEVETRQRGLRYADDMIFFLKPGEDADALRLKLDQFLAERGLKVKESKTQLVESIKGFDFLGWHFKVKQKNQKFVCYPSKKNRDRVKKKIKMTMRDSRRPIHERLSRVKLIYRGWRNYHQYCDMSQVNTWGISKWVYRFGRKRTSMDKKRLLERVRDIFNGHSYKVNGYISVRHKMDLRYDSLSYKKYQCGRIELEIQSVGTKSWYKEARSTFRLTPGAGCGESRTSGFELESHL